MEPGLSLKHYRAIKKQGGGDVEMSSSSDEDYVSANTLFSIQLRFVCDFSNVSRFEFHLVFVAYALSI